MDPPLDWDRIWTLFHAARERPQEERGAFLDSAASEDADLRAHVEALLQADEEDPRFLASAQSPSAPSAPAVPSAPDAAGEPPDSAATRAMFTPPRVPRTIGHYHIKRVIGAGGMGTVYEAVQEQPRRVVALKVLKAGIASRSALRRFEYESQILARLHHPGIAHVYEAGTHDDGSGAVPFFAMEYIPNAKAITEYADAKKLGAHERLKLFEIVCDAVHHGHQKGIIHRDLKPENILVDSLGQPKVIDFGVARSTDSDMVVTTFQTDIGQLIGTLQYMSPEQCEADPHGLDIRSDVYALGVMLYELLCGELPYDLSRKAVHEAARAIREENPIRPSTFNRMLRGDVEIITLKALEKERDRRYQSARELGQDVERYLGGEAIEARAPGALYRLGRFLRRNRVRVAATIAIAVLFVTSGIFLQRALRESGRSRDLARLLEEEEQRKSDFLEPLEDRLARTRLENTIVSLRHSGAPLEEVIDSIAARTGLEVRVEWTNLAQIVHIRGGRAVERGSPVTIDLDNVTAAAALDLVLRQVSEYDAQYAFADGMIVVSSDEAMRRQTVTITYDVSDLIEARPYRDRDLNDRVEQLVSLIEENVDPAGWRDLGGDTGTLQRHDDTFVVTNTRANHRSIRDLLAGLRGGGAEPGATARDAVSRTRFVETEIDRSARKRLMDTVLPITFEDAPLEEVFDVLRAATRLRWNVDWPSLAEIGISPADPITLRLSSARVDVVLDLVLDRLARQFELSRPWGRRPRFSILDGTVLVSSHVFVVTRLYNVNDLLDSLDTVVEPSDRAGVWQRVSQLAELIQNVVDPDGWRDRGGDMGSLQEFDGVLLITNTPANQTAIEELLDELRRKRDSPASPVPMSEPARSRRDLLPTLEVALAAVDGDDQRGLRRYLAAARSGERDWRWEYLRHLSDSSLISLPALGPPGRLDFSANGSALLTVSREGVSLWTLDDRRDEVRVHGGDGWRDRVQAGVLVDGDHFIRIVKGYSCETWDARTGARVHSWSIGHRLTLSEDASTAACTVPGTGRETNVPAIYDASNGERRSTLRLPEVRGYLRRAALNRDGTRLAACRGYADLEIDIWNTATGELLCTLSEPGHTPSRLFFSPNGERLAATTGGGGIVVWDLRLSKAEQQLDDGAEGSDDPLILFVPDSNGMLVRWPSGPALLYDLTTEKRRTAFPRITRRSEIAFSPDGVRLASTGDDGAIVIWQTASAARLTTLRGLAHATVLAFSPDGRRLAAGDADGTVKLWALPTDEELARTRTEQETAVEDALAFVEPLLGGGLAPTDVAARVGKDDSLTSSARERAMMYLVRRDLRLSDD